VTPLVPSALAARVTRSRSRNIDVLFTFAMICL
jgi:hypothetical protein